MEPAAASCSAAAAASRPRRGAPPQAGGAQGLPWRLGPAKFGLGLKLRDEALVFVVATATAVTTFDSHRSPNVRGGTAQETR